GGEEFAVVFAGKTAEQCAPHLEAVREAIAGYGMHLRDQSARPLDDNTGRQRRAGSSGDTVTVTISLGVAERQGDNRSVDEVLKAADQALYAAKAAGRNCLMVHGLRNRRGAVREA
ncbi:MAG TPA: GGDEF domain-containing protein, partial [Pseudomonas sp.]|nr:GGDEF domain-containing protein [Pseudomonas sp.]